MDTLPSPEKSESPGNTSSTRPAHVMALCSHTCTDPPDRETVTDYPHTESPSENLAPESSGIDEVDGLFVNSVIIPCNENRMTTELTTSMPLDGEKTKLFIKHDLQDTPEGDYLDGNIMTTKENGASVHLFTDLSTSKDSILYEGLGIRENDVLISMDGREISFAIPSVSHIDAVSLFKYLELEMEHVMVILRRSTLQYLKIQFQLKGVQANVIKKKVIHMTYYESIQRISIQCPGDRYLSVGYIQNKISCAPRTTSDAYKCNVIKKKVIHMTYCESKQGISIQCLEYLSVGYIQNEIRCSPKTTFHIFNFLLKQTSVPDNKRDRLWFKVSPEASPEKRLSDQDNFLTVLESSNSEFCFIESGCGEYEIIKRSRQGEMEKSVFFERGQLLLVDQSYLGTTNRKKQSHFIITTVNY